ncbi:MAG: glycosyltransferase family 9 protein [Bdellovibrionales bacterium]
MEKKIDCLHFNGYKPCGFNEICDSSCSYYTKKQMRILVVHLEAMGAVLRASSILKPLKRKFPNSSIHWVTKAPSHQFFKNNIFVDKTYALNQTTELELLAQEFDVVFCIDKSKEAVGLSNRVKTELTYGFGSSSNGAIVPLNQEAHELWEIGLSDHLKFKVNEKTETQLMTEALGLEWRRDNYMVHLSADELDLSFQRRLSWSEQGQKKIIGINTGCANVVRYKRLTDAKQLELVRAIEKNFEVSIVLLGGPDDTERNQSLAARTDSIASPTRKGVRDGMVSIASCDLVISGDSLGMHMAIALKKPVIAWFGPTCTQEIDLYDRGQKITTNLDCGPCWKRSCSLEVKCNELQSIKPFLVAIHEELFSVERSHAFNFVFETEKIFD